MQYIRLELLHEIFFIVGNSSFVYVHLIMPVLLSRGQYLHKVLLQKLYPLSFFLMKEFCFLPCRFGMEVDCIAVVSPFSGLGFAIGFTKSVISFCLTDFVGGAISFSMIFCGFTKNGLIVWSLSRHFGDIIRDENDKTIPQHFNSKNHKGIKDIKITVLEYIKKSPKSPQAGKIRLRREAHWTHLLHTLSPNGLNMENPKEFKLKI